MKYMMLCTFELTSVIKTGVILCYCFGYPLLLDRGYYKNRNNLIINKVINQ